MSSDRPMNRAAAERLIGNIETGDSHVTRVDQAGQGLAALDGALARHVDQAELPGLVALVARDDDVHVAEVGHRAFGDSEPIGRDAIFRIRHLTRAFRFVRVATAGRAGTGR